MEVGFIGLGAMGGPMAKRLVEAGCGVIGFDVSPAAVARFEAAGGQPAGSAKAVGDRAEIVLCSLPNAAIVAEVVHGPDGLLAGSARRTYVELSTIGAPAARAISQSCGQAGVGYVDSPVSGGVAGAEAGTLAIMVSGPAPAVDSVEPWLDQLGSVIRVGSLPGQAQVVKLANNLLSASAIVLSTEAVLLAVKSGVDPRVAMEVMSQGTGRNSAVADKFPRRVVTRGFDSGFRLALLAKDLRLCLAAADDVDAPMLAGRCVESLVALAESQFGHEADSLDYVRLVEGWAGARIDDSDWQSRV